MTTNNATVNNNIIGFTGLLTIIFVLLKVFGKITWSWFWVFSPLIFNAILVVAILLIILIIWLVVK